MSLTYETASNVLMNELRLYHNPIAVTFLFNDDEVEEFRAKHEVFIPARPTTFCQWEIAARMKAKTVLGFKDKLACPSGRISFGWKEIDETEYKNQLRYTKDLEQAKRFVDSKVRLKSDSLKAVAVGPLAAARMQPSSVHFYCDNMQSYHLAVDWMAAADMHPLRANITMSSCGCGGNVFAYLERQANILPACSGEYNSGKAERGEVNVMIPGLHILATVERLLERRQKTGTASLTSPGDPFPGADICKNCPLISFKKEEAE